ncbi:hypothetical protein SCLCIDRAFT_27491 [Scleroderma citrinum Foug A]|uniref:SPRY domain-containing protein n=1 Tax=Scleroderma citrinum Foug A TaxID=1036808 RepID=A0A0C3A3H2_9AGAM|nr:hypothetical protein SCLCIDRAFT_27491 [Scleroderma citrinum Foug A]
MSTQRELEEVPRPDDGVIPPSIHSWMRETAVGKFVLSLVQNKRLKLQDIRTLTESPPVAGDHWRIFLGHTSRLRFKDIMMNSIEWLNTSASVRMRHINAWLVPVCALFQGRVVDKAESPIPGMPQTWGVVNNTVYILQGAILSVVEMKLSLKGEKDYIAQVLLELAYVPNVHRTIRDEQASFRYALAGVATPRPALPCRTIESAPPRFRVSWEDRSAFIQVTTDSLGLLGERGFRSARRNTSMREGAWYMEVRVECDNCNRAPDIQDTNMREWGWTDILMVDNTGDEVHLSRSRPYGRSFHTGDVIGMYIFLPPRQKPDNAGPHDPANFKRERMSIELKWQE